MFPTLIVPGLNGSPEGHWQRHWAAERADATVIEQDDWNCPVIDDWQAELDRALSKTDGAFIVAHSLGCQLVASYAKRANADKILGALLVAPCSLAVTRRLHPCMIEFGDEALSRLPFSSLVVGSLNDPYMSVPDLEHHVKIWDSDLTTIGFAGHINVASGYGRWVEGYGLFDRLNSAKCRASPRPASLTDVRASPSV